MKLFGFFLLTVFLSSFKPCFSGSLNPGKDKGIVNLNIDYKTDLSDIKIFQFNEYDQEFSSLEELLKDITQIEIQLNRNEPGKTFYNLEYTIKLSPDSLKNSSRMVMRQ